MNTSLFRSAAGIGLAAALSACAATGAPTSMYTMPSTPQEARPPADANPSSPAELAEGALYLLDPSRPGGPDYPGAARMCLLAIEMSDPYVERDLRRACYRTAARSALRSGDRELYVKVIDRWERDAPRNERAAGEFAIHRAIADRLNGRATGRIPPELRGLLPPVEEARL